VLATGDEIVATLTAFASRERLSAARFTAIGALSDAVLEAPAPLARVFDPRSGLGLIDVDAPLVEGLRRTGAGGWLG
jgi:predicted DNA-binding protein with PD1-like motif